MSISKINIFFKVSVNKIWVSSLLKVYMAFAFAFAFTLPLTFSVSILTQWFPDRSDYDGDHILPWPSGVLYLTSHIQGDSVLTKHKDDMKHETFIDEPLILSTWLHVPRDHLVFRGKGEEICRHQQSIKAWP